MGWRLFAKGPLFSRIFVYEEDGKPKFLSPLYISSFSSFGDPDFCSRAVATLRSLRSVVPESELPPILLSAYDLKRRLAVGSGSNQSEKWAALSAELNQGFRWQLDSGVYEKDCFGDSTWGPSEFVPVFQALNPTWVVGFDLRPDSQSIADFEKALRIASDGVKHDLSDSVITLLVHFHEQAGLWEKNTEDSEPARIEALLGTLITILRELDDRVNVLGVVENELGPGIRSRLRSLARLYGAFDRASIEMPIHVFGASDPQALALYSLAGANIFDGVNWSRYYLDTEDCCMRDKGLMSWKEPALGEASGISNQAEMLGVGNVLRMRRFTAALHRQIENGKPRTVREEAWFEFVRSCCEGIPGREA